jgi:pimeloyl-ACP methyl ester carboxylesterase
MLDTLFMRKARSTNGKKTSPPASSSAESLDEATSGADRSHDTPPNMAMLALEFRAPWEWSSVMAAWAVLQRAPRGDAHSVIAFPGLSAGDSSTLPLRKYLDSLGYDTHGWDQGMNFGPRAGVLNACKRLINDTVQASGKPVSLVGWSLGGVYARELAKELPEQVRCVITLGTPFAGGPKATNAWRLYQLTSGRDIERETGQYDLPVAPHCPTSSIYSRTDGIVAWQASWQEPQKHNQRTENIEVHASHFGIGINAAAWWAVADRLAQDPEQWKPFEKPRMLGLGPLRSLVFPDVPR